MKVCHKTANPIRAGIGSSAGITTPKPTKKAPTTPTTKSLSGNDYEKTGQDSSNLGIRPGSQHGTASAFDVVPAKRDFSSFVRAELAAIGNSLQHIEKRQASIASSQLSLQCMLEQIPDAAADKPAVITSYPMLCGSFHKDDSDVAVASGIARTAESSDTCQPLVAASEREPGSLSKPVFQEEIFILDGRGANMKATPSRLFQQARNRRQQRLEHLFRVNNKLQADAEVHRKADEAKKKQGTVNKLRSMEKLEMETWLDSLMSGVILTNAVFIGLSLDHEEEMEGANPWELVDVTFTLIFIFELIAKIYFHGFCQTFCTGRDRWSNLFDAFLVTLDSTQVSLGVFMAEAKESLDEQGLPAPSLFRVVRLVRLTRLIRLLRYEVFADLLAMVQGLYGGGLTLFWAVVVFVLITYCTALVCRDLFGNKGHPHVSIYFNSVPRAMFTVFRCSFGDCSSKDGYPIPEYIISAYGGGFGLAYCCLIFFTVVGLFNVISAIFVDSTMQANAELAQKKTREKLSDENLLAASISTIIDELLRRSHSSISSKNWLQHMEELVEIEFAREDVEELMRNCLPVQHALHELDIDWHEHRRLPDILDPDHSGTINVLELVNGLGRLRGQPRRSDVVSVELMVRSLQEVVDELHDSVTHMKTVQESIHRKVNHSIGLEEPEVYI